MQLWNLVTVLGDAWSPSFTALAWKAEIVLWKPGIRSKGKTMT